jgi:hypothetical protein
MVEMVKQVQMDATDVVVKMEAKGQRDKTDVVGKMVSDSLGRGLGTYVILLT